MANTREQGTFWSPENIGDSVTGVLTEKKKNVGRYKSMLYILTQDTEEYLIWGKKHLDLLMKDAALGDMVTITLKDIKKEEKFKMYEFDVEINDEIIVNTKQEKIIKTEEEITRENPPGSTITTEETKSK